MTVTLAQLFLHFNDLIQTPADRAALHAALLAALGAGAGAGDCHWPVNTAVNQQGGGQ